MENKEMHDREIEYLKEHVKDLYKREWELQTEEVQHLMKEFVEIATTSNFTAEQIGECMQNLAASDVSLLVSLFPIEQHDDIDQVMVDMYTTNFINLVEGKKGVIKFENYAKYKKDLLAGKFKRFITISEVFYIMNGLKANPLLMFFDRPCDNKYVIELKKYYKERQSVKDRNKEYYLIKEVKPILLEDCVARAKQMVEEHII